MNNTIKWLLCCTDAFAVGHYRETTFFVERAADGYLAQVEYGKIVRQIGLSETIAEGQALCQCCVVQDQT